MENLNRGGFILGGFFGGILSAGIFWGDFIPGGFYPPSNFLRGFYPRGVLSSGGFYPRGIFPDTERNNTTVIKPLDMCSRPTARMRSVLLPAFIGFV